MRAAMRATKSLLCLLAFAATILFAAGCDLDYVDIIVPGYGGHGGYGYGGGPIIAVYDDDYYDDYDDYYADYYYDDDYYDYY